MKAMHRLCQTIIIVVLTILAAIGMIVAVYMHHQATVMGSNIGSASGKIVGTAIGSVAGITEGISKGAEDGANAGLSAEDTSSEVEGTMESIGKLEVLAAGVTLKNINNIGKAYSGLYVISGDAIFTVDLSQALVSYNDEKTDVYIQIPEPQLELYLDQNTTEELAKIQHFSLTVTAQDGIVDYLNSMAQTVDSAKDSMANYDSLMTAAKQAAISQVEILASTVCDEQMEVHVSFQ